MIWTTETVLMGRDAKGNPVAFWSKHTGHKMDLMYLVKQVKISDVERFGEDMFYHNTAESLKLKVAGVNITNLIKKDEEIIQD